MLGMAARSGSCCVAAEADRPAALELCGQSEGTAAAVGTTKCFILLLQSESC